MKLFQKHYLYYIVFEVRNKSKNSRSLSTQKNVIELELRQKISSLVHCEQIIKYINEMHYSDSKNKPEIIILNFILLRTHTRFFSKG